MASLKHVRWWLVVGLLSAASFQLAFTLNAVEAEAQELSTPLKMWRATVAYLGQPAGTSGQEFTQYDSTYDLIPAINDGIRRVAIDVGVAALDTITVAANTFAYALNTDFLQIQDGDKPNVPYNCTRISANTKTITGMKKTPLSEFGTVTGGAGGVQAPSSEAIGFSVVGRTLWIYPAGTVGDKIYVSGPADGIEITHGADTTNIYNADRWAVVYWAVSELAKSRGNAELASDFMNKYIQHVTARTGRSPLPQGGQ